MKDFSTALLLSVLLALTGCAAEDVTTVQGLKSDVEIVRDRWGVSHIYAANQDDLFFAQGYNAARDRLFQLELWRRQATGTLSEVLGEKALAQDVGARLLSFRKDMGDELGRYHPDGQAIVGSFVAGINAYIRWAKEDPGRLPLEFRLLGTQPGEWTPEVVVSRHNGLFRNVSDEVLNALLVADAGAERAARLLDLTPPLDRVDIPEGLDLKALSGDVLALYAASRQAISFEASDLVSQSASARLRLPGLSRPIGRLGPDVIGSNNWVIAPSKSSTGAAWMANDPHRRLALPSLRYFVHLSAPGWNVVGGGEPALPGVSIGHNDSGAWGLTIFSVDQEDLYVYDTDPADPMRYRYGDGWERMSSVVESFAVKGKQLVRRELFFTRHGPVVYRSEDRRKAYAVRAAWLEPGTSPYLASLRFDQASSWEEFRQACSRFLAPSENMVWADRDGNIGWQATGITPLRPNWTGLLPVPGDGRFEWDGFLPVLELPHLFNPPQGFIATANQYNLPAGYPHAVGYQWSEPFRKRRLDEVLSAMTDADLEKMEALQQDFVPLPARTLMGWARALPASEASSQLLERLLRWNGVLDPDSSTAAVYAMWERMVLRTVADRMAPRGDYAAGLDVPTMGGALAWLSGLQASERNSLLRDALNEAATELEKRFGPAPESWRYGDTRFHQVAIRHSLSPAVDEAARERLDAGPLPRGGGRYTVNMTTGNDNQTSGATFRVIVDLSDWDKSVGTNAPGQSGDPGSPHYRDLFEPWAKGAYFPLLFSRQAVDANAESRIVLKAKGPQR